MAKTGKEAEQPETEEQTPTAEEQLETLTVKLNESNTKYGALENSYKGLQTTVNEKDRKLKEQTDLGSRLDGFEETQRILAAMVAEQSQVEEGTPKEDYLKKFDELTVRQAEKRKQDTLKTEQEEYNAKGYALLETGKAAFGDDEDGYDKFEDAVYGGRFEKAQKLIERAKNNPQKPKETDEEIEERIKQKVLQDNNLLQTESAKPSGITANDKQIVEDYIKDPDDAKNFEAHEDYLRRTRK